MKSCSPTKMLYLLFVIPFCSASGKAPPQILSFTFEEWNQNQWKSSTDIERGKTVRLVCTLDSQSADLFNIKSTQKDTGTLEYLESSLHSNNRQVISELRNLDCSDSGVYVCDNGIGVSQTIELGIFGCEPRLCDIEGSTTVVKAAALNKSCEISICVQGYPGVGVDIIATPYDTNTETQTTRGIHMPSKQNADSDGWGYEVEPVPNAFGEFLVRIEKDVLRQEDYGVYTFSIYTVHEGNRKQLKYKLVLEPTDKGPPECPTNLKITNQEAESLTLSWQPGFDRGAAQYFLVYMLSENGEWILTGTPTRENYMSLNDLYDNTVYSFKVIAMNRFLPSVPSASLCQNVVEGITAKLENDDRNPTKLTVIISAVCVASVLIVITIAVYFICLRKSNLLAQVWKSRFGPTDETVVGDHGQARDLLDRQDRPVV